jgi:hypothetical protein
MYAANKTVLIAGILMIVLTIGFIVTIGAGSATGDYSPFEKDEVAKYLTDVNDSRTAVLISGAVGIINDGFLGVALAALFYVLFRDRSRLLATVVLAGLLVQSAISLVVDGSGILLTIIAKDFVNGGPPGVAAGDPAALEVGRYVGMITLIFTNVLFTPLGLALIALGTIITSAPPGAINPPRWMGWVACFTGACAELAWFVVVIDIGFVFFIGTFLGSLIFILSLGVWLVMHRDLQPATT